MIGIIFLALVMIGGGSVYYSIQQYKAKQNENIREKIRSVYIELDHKLSYETRLNQEWQSEQYANLNELLIKFSNVFYSDINLYDPSGNLLATSRPEIFIKGLVGTIMDNLAYRQLVINRQAEFVHNEQIGEMNYLSAYVPFTNNENKLLAYLNLPYFTKQSMLTREISTLVVTIVNISFLLILLTISLAVVISDTITNPLRVIQRKFSKIQLGKTGETIDYKGRDEIADLVEEYNRMVKELANSMVLLARSERESAWREMAKQIAHEIKNPLTPMKLSIQQIQRSWDDRVPDWESHLKKFTQTMIEQIDNLSAIATAFSSFAQMPKTEFQPVDIIEKIKNSVSLYTTSDEVRFTTNFHGIKEAWVFADREQISRVFTNLIQNAIQSLPGDQKGIIDIELTITDDRVTVAITDNGRGISDELGDKLFMPNFTTKSSGMGLGLAIVKNIVDNTQGRIYYETEVGTGSTFYVELPRYHPESLNKKSTQ
jgi:signal transduction histidine kinase